jgi:hypothetical protein
LPAPAVLRTETPCTVPADQLGRLLRTLFLCDYFSNPELGGAAIVRTISQIAI